MDIIDSTINNINSVGNNKYFIGIMMVVLNIGGRYVMQDLGKTHELFFSNKMVKRLLSFSIFFVATRDIFTSIILTILFNIFVLELTNEKSPYCIIPKSFYQLDSNKDGEISPDEIKKAYLTLKNAGQIEAFKNRSKK